MIATNLSFLSNPADPSSPLNPFHPVNPMSPFHDLKQKRQEDRSSQTQLKRERSPGEQLASGVMKTVSTPMGYGALGGASPYIYEFGIMGGLPNNFGGRFFLKAGIVGALLIGIPLEVGRQMAAVEKGGKDAGVAFLDGVTNVSLGAASGVVGAYVGAKIGATAGSWAGPAGLVAGILVGGFVGWGLQEIRNWEG